MAEHSDSFRDLTPENLEWLLDHLHGEARAEFSDAVTKAAFRLQLDPGNQVVLAEIRSLIESWLVSTHLRENPDWQVRMAATADLESLPADSRAWTSKDLDDLLKL